MFAGLCRRSAAAGGWSFACRQCGYLAANAPESGQPKSGATMDAGCFSRQDLDNLFGLGGYCQSLRVRGFLYCGILKTGSYFTFLLTLPRLSSIRSCQVLNLPLTPTQRSVPRLPGSTCTGTTVFPGRRRARSDPSEPKKRAHGLPRSKQTNSTNPGASCETSPRSLAPSPTPLSCTILNWAIGAIGAITLFPIRTECGLGCKGAGV